MNKLREVKGAMGLKKMMKEVAGNIRPGKQEDEYIGGAKIPLKSIRASGIETWYNLGTKHKKDVQGKLRVRMNFIAKKPFAIASQEHRDLLKVLLHHEIELAKANKKVWNENLSELSEALVIQHQAQSELTRIDVAFAQWFVFVHFHQQHPISFEIFEHILGLLYPQILSKQLPHPEELNDFLESSKLLLHSCFNLVLKLHGESTDANLPKSFASALKVMSKLFTFGNSQVNFLTSKLYNWLSVDELKLGLRNVLDLAVTIGTNEYFEKNVKYEEWYKEDVMVQLKMFSGVVKLVKLDLQTAYGTYDKYFKE